VNVIKDGIHENYHMDLGAPAAAPIESGNTTDNSTAGREPETRGYSASG
jgi:hypothetical protein